MCESYSVSVCPVLVLSLTSAPGDPGSTPERVNIPEAAKKKYKNSQPQETHLN